MPPVSTGVDSIDAVAHPGDTNARMTMSNNPYFNISCSNDNNHTNTILIINHKEKTKVSDQEQPINTITEWQQLSNDKRRTIYTLM